MSKNTISWWSVILILSGIVGMGVSGLSAAIASAFAIGVGVLGIKNALLD